MNWWLVTCLNRLHQLNCMTVKQYLFWKFKPFRFVHIPKFAVSFYQFRKLLNTVLKLTDFLSRWATWLKWLIIYCQTSGSQLYPISFPNGTEQFFGMVIPDNEQFDIQISFKPYFEREWIKLANVIAGISETWQPDLFNWITL